MGSSKKHKEKDKDREHKHKHRRRSRSRSKERKRQRTGDVGKEGREKRSTSRKEYDQQEVTDGDYASAPVKKESTDGYQPSSSSGGGGGGGGGGATSTSSASLSLSIEETNRLRTKLGLRPLELSDFPTKEEGAKSGDEDVHAPPVNISTVKKTEKLRDRLSTQKQRRKMEEKLSTIKTLGESDSDEEHGAHAWVQKNRKQSKEKQMADKRAKLLEEMEEDFGIGNIVQDEFKEHQKRYTPKDLKGLKVEHSLEHFKEGQSIILTLKDRGVLDDEDAEVLVNYNLIDDEKAAKNVENKKKKPDYKPYDEPEYDEYGVSKATDILDKYDEEISGPKMEYFELGSGGQYDSMMDKRMDRIRSELRQQGQSLAITAPQIAGEYFTQDEMDAKFRKTKRKARKIRKREVLKADDLLQLPDPEDPANQYGSRSRGRGWADDADEDPHQYQMPENGAVKSELGAHAEAMEINRYVNEGDLLGPDEDLTGVPVEEDTAQQELQRVLNKTRKLKQKKERSMNVAQAVAEITQEEENPSPDEKGSMIILNATSEFCRGMGEIPTYGLSGNRDEERDEILDLEMELMEQRKKKLEEEEHGSGWNLVEIDETPVTITGEETGVLDDEPMCNEGVGAALSLANKKGYLEKDTGKKLVPGFEQVNLKVANYTIEDKRYDDLDEKYRKRDRYQGGIIQEFKEKELYRPDVKLEYVDDGGRAMNAKEAFRQLSHRFHGKGSGKRKQEKRQKKLEEDLLMKAMSSTDTPLGTVNLLREKQRSEKTPYVVLTGNKGFTTNTISKPH